MRVITGICSFLFAALCFSSGVYRLAHVETELWWTLLCLVFGVMAFVGGVLLLRGQSPLGHVWAILFYLILLVYLILRNIVEGLGMMRVNNVILLDFSWFLFPLLLWVIAWFIRDLVRFKHRAQFKKSGSEGANN